MKKNAKKKFETYMTIFILTNTGSGGSVKKNNNKKKTIFFFINQQKKIEKKLKSINYKSVKQLLTNFS